MDIYIANEDNSVQSAEKIVYRQVILNTVEKLMSHLNC